MANIPTTQLPEVEVTATPLTSGSGRVLRIRGTDYGGWTAVRVRRISGTPPGTSTRLRCRFRSLDGTAGCSLST